jgi:hypothetical protein
VDAAQDSTEPGDDSGGISAQLDTLLAELDPTTDLARLVERIARNGLPWVVVPTAALTAWEQRNPAGWAKVSACDVLPENSATRGVRIRLRMPAGRAPRCGGNGSPKSRSSGS